ncbi:MAG: class I SAM-dependent RNA methyltransferase [Oscillospiraceae bacterium]|nr:class I SAM-dependent RNA methyltransferase [Oscillospiraceae bacterium]
MEYTFCVPCLFGLEGLVADELRRLELSGVAAENGRVYFTGGTDAIAAANVNLRKGERVLLELGSFPATSFEALFEGTRALPWEEWIPADGAFPVTGHSLNSKLFSVSDCQRILKKAVAERLKGKYGLQWFPETGAVHQIRFSIMKDQVSLCLDTSGQGLHKRGYRPAHNAAPLRETLAAAMVGLARYRGRGDLCDPFCGSGTIPIEAALIARNRAPGLARHFAAMDWPVLDAKIWEDARERARAREFHGDYSILGSDIDPKAVSIARENARRAGVDDVVRFEVADATAFSRSTERGVIVTNPPYGERILEKQDAEALYRGFGRALAACPNWQVYLLSSHTEFERCFGRQADKKRKLYNGMIKCDLFMYYK